MIIIPDLFTPYIQGRELGIERNWNDMNNFNKVQAGQLDNMFNLATFGPKVNREYEQTERDALSNMVGEMNFGLLNATYPGRLATALAQNALMQRYGGTTAASQLSRNLSGNMADITRNNATGPVIQAQLEALQRANAAAAAGTQAAGTGTPNTGAAAAGAAPGIPNPAASKTNIPNAGNSAAGNSAGNVPDLAGGQTRNASTVIAIPSSLLGAPVNGEPLPMTRDVFNSDAAAGLRSQLSAAGVSQSPLSEAQLSALRGPNNVNWGRVTGLFQNAQPGALMYDPLASRGVFRVGSQGERQFMPYNNAGGFTGEFYNLPQ